jgi:dTDP-4-amino-4,6-dideoxygalactose transaminase
MGRQSGALYSKNGGPMHVPFLDLKDQHSVLKEKILQAWASILDSAQFIGGENLDAFEKDFAKCCETKHCVAVNSGTDALRLILEALNVGPDDEIITVPNTFIATTEAISQAGAKIVFVDVDPDTYNMDPHKIETAVSPKSVGILPVHLYGQTADMDPILAVAQRHKLWVVEDACQAHLAQYKGHPAGSLGTAAAFSFYPGKNLGGCGEGGAVTTSDGKLAERIRMLRNHGQIRKYDHQIEGCNSRFDALQAAVLRIKLKYLPEWNAQRRKHAGRYYKKLEKITGIKLPQVLHECRPVYHLFVVQVENRDRVADYLAKMGIHTAFHYPQPLHFQNAYRHLNYKKNAFPIAESYTAKLMSLPMYPELTPAQIDYVCDGLIAAVAACK